MIKRDKQSLFLHFVYCIVRRDRNIEGCSSVCNLRQHRLIGIEGLIDNLCSCLLFKFRDQVRVDVISPIIDREGIPAGIALLRIKNEGKVHQSQRCYDYYGEHLDYSFHSLTSASLDFAPCLLMK